MARYSILEEIRKQDPSYDPIPSALEKAGISPALYRFAKRAITYDGWHGPFTLEYLFEECSPEERGLTKEEVEQLGEGEWRDVCLTVLREVAEQIDDYTQDEFYPCEGECICGSEDCQCFNCETKYDEHYATEIMYEGDIIAKDIFSFVQEIYGGSIFAY